MELPEAPGGKEFIAQAEDGAGGRQAPTGRDDPGQGVRQASLTARL